PRNPRASPEQWRTKEPACGDDTKPAPPNGGAGNDVCFERGLNAAVHLDAAALVVASVGKRLRLLHYREDADGILIWCHLERRRGVENDVLAARGCGMKRDGQQWDRRERKRKQGCRDHLL